MPWSGDNPGQIRGWRGVHAGGSTSFSQSRPAWAGSCGGLRAPGEDPAVEPTRVTLAAALWVVPF
jgi:hypothetical protein